MKTSKTSIGLSLFTLALGMESIALAGLVWPIARVENYSEKENERRALEEILEILEERREEVL